MTLGIYLTFLSQSFFISKNGGLNEMMERMPSTFPGTCAVNGRGEGRLDYILGGKEGASFI